MEAEELGALPLQRHLLLEVCGAISVRNLQVPEGFCQAAALPDVFCELWRGEQLVYRTGLVRRSLNPTWTLRSRVAKTVWPEIGPGQGADPNASWRAPLTLHVRGLTNPRGSASDEGMDAFPYHHEDAPEDARCATIFEREIVMSKLQSTGRSTTELHRLDIKSPNEVILGVWPGRLTEEISVPDPVENGKASHEPTVQSNDTSASSQASEPVENGKDPAFQDFSSSSTSPFWALGVRKGAARAGSSLLAYRLHAGAQDVANITTSNSKIPDKDEVAQALGGAHVYDKLLGTVRDLLNKQREMREVESALVEVVARKAGTLRGNVADTTHRRRLQRLVDQKAALARACKEKRDLLAARRDALQGTLEALGKAQDSVIKANEETDPVAKAAEAEQVARRALAKERILTRVHRISILRALLRIYPLQERNTDAGVWVYTIRGMQVPATPMDPALLGSYEEEQVSTALGYLAHFVSLLSKYVDIPLRYLPLPHSSSSTICDPLIVCAETPHEPMSRAAHHQASGSSSFPQHIFGSASGRLGRVIARRALSNGTFPLHWKDLKKTLRPRFTQGVDILARDVQLLAFVHAFRAGSASPSPRQHMVAQLKDIFDEFGPRVSHAPR
ncbi:UV radiation resistance associated protein [Hondaea fermentalgiana]|uniref:UV radiation resistance associated protein n=1 Tax=Hondaea fermentalgiana TaxID=2315210 RepID=A0A2R5GP91_9STRA|nr:UV radiation resistance associated protein [Hondaea fermentalgiana]|eukprot:GBG32696.1 UV radiation resistance associated protein [Hondaea fermentalgiana]